MVLDAMSLIDAIGLGGIVVFAMSGALAASRQRMDPVGFVLLGTVTAVGGGTIRDTLLDVPVFWIQGPEPLLIAVATSVLTYIIVPGSISRHKWVAWCDAAGLAAFAVQGTMVALQLGAPDTVAVGMGVLTATAGGVVRDVLAGERPMILGGQLYASTALLGATAIVISSGWGAPVAAVVGFVICFAARAAAIVFDIRMGPPGELITVRRASDDGDDGDGDGETGTRG